MSASSSGEPTFSDIFRLHALYHRRFYLFSLLICLSIGGGIIFFYPKEYTHFGMIEIHPDRTPITNFFIVKDSRIFGSYDYKRSEVERQVLVSHSVVETAVKAVRGYMTYRDNPGFLSAGEEIFETRPFMLKEESGRRLLPCVIDVQVESDSLFTYRIDGIDHTAYWGDSVMIGNVKAVFAPIQDLMPYYAGHTIRITVSDIEETIKTLSAKINTEHPGQSSSILIVEIPEATPGKSDAYVNALMLTFVRALNHHRRASLHSAITQLDVLLDGVTSDLKAIEDDLHKWRQNSAKNNLVTIQKTLMDDPKTWAQKVSLRTDSVACDRFLAIMADTTLRHTPIAFTLTKALPSLTSTIKQYNSLLTTRRQMAETALPTNPQLVATDEIIASLREFIFNSVQAYADQLKTALASAQSRDNRAYTMFDSLYSSRTPVTLYIDFQRTKQIMYRYLSKKKVTAEANLHAMPPDAQIVQYSGGDNRPTHAPRKKILAFSLMAGLLIPYLCISGRRWLLPNGLRPIDIRRELGEYHYLGALPQSKPHHSSALEQAAHAMAGRLVQLPPTMPHNVITMTSSRPGEGKTYSSISLACGLTTLGMRVLIIDADLRRRTLSQRFGFLNVPGLCDLLKKHTTISETDISALIHTVKPSSSVKNLSFLPAGSSTQDTAELLNSNAMLTFIATARSLFDYVLFDTPPLPVVTDASILAYRTDMLCYVMRAGVTPIKSLPGIRYSFMQGEFTNVALLLNGVSDKA